MNKSHLEHVAGGGVLGRRSFLKSGFQFTLATALPATETANTPVGARLPDSMRRLGRHDSGYGGPAIYEQHVQRTQTVRAPQTEGFMAWHSPLAHQRGVITPNGLHFAIHHNGIPDIAPESHALMIHGWVERPLRFDLERLLRYPMVSRVQFLECSGNSAANALSPTAMDVDCQTLHGQVSCAEWTGIPLACLLREVGLKAGAKWVIAEGADGGSHSRSLPLSKLLDDAILALYQNGERLHPSQGYPMRLFVPGWEGNVNVKWVHRLEVTDNPAYSKDESGLYAEVLSNGAIERFTFPMGVKSVITHPSGLQQLPEVMGFYEISGLAWSGHGRITCVEVSADGGLTWAEAQLQAPVLDKAFTRFSIPWQWRGQKAVLMSRATDERGHTQPTRDDWKARYAAHSFNHYNAIQAWHIGRDGRVENRYV